MVGVCLRSIWLVLAIVVQIPCISSESIDSSFYLLHHDGQGVSFDKDSKVLTLHSTLSQRFRWKGLFLMHVPTNQCVVPSEEGKAMLSLSALCGSNDTYFHYETQSHMIRHLKSGKCLQPANDTFPNRTLVLEQDCQNGNSMFWQIPEALYIIRHFGGLCWVYYTPLDVLKLQKTHICDRFVFDSEWHLKHYRTGKCVYFHLGFLRLTTDCNTTKNSFIHTANATLENLSSHQCVKPFLGGAAPLPAADLILTECVEEDQFLFHLHLAKGIYQVSLFSESCDDVSICGLARSVIEVNGHDFSALTRGISVAIFDYQSGILEFTKAYDVYAYSSHRVQLATLLNGLADGKLLLMAVRDAVNLDTGLATALRRLGVSSEFARTYPVTTKMSMVALLYTGHRRKEWEKVVHFVGKGPSILVTKIFAFRDYQGTDECDEEMGLLTGHLSDSRFSAKSVYGNSPAYGPHEARLFRTAPGWCSGAYSPVTDYLQIDLASIKVLSGIALQGHGTWKGRMSVTSFFVQHSTNGIDWSTYSENSTDFEFQGCSTLGETVVHWFKRTEMRFIRIAPKARTAGDVTHCIRMELFGCSPKGIFLQDGLFKETFIVSEIVKANFTFYGTSPWSGLVNIEMSVHEQNTTLADNMDQFMVGTGLQGTLLYANGTSGLSATVRRLKSVISPFPIAVSTTFSNKEAKFSNFDVFIRGKAIDNGKGLSVAWGMLSFESGGEVRLLGKEVSIQPPQRFEAHLGHYIAVNKEAREAMLSNGDTVIINLTLRHQLQGSRGSTANAYNLQVYVSYNPLLLTVLSFKTILKSATSLQVSKNTTRPGLIHFQTDIFWFQCIQSFNISFKVNIIKKVRKASMIEGEIAVEYSYTKNLPKFNGSAVYIANNYVDFKCQVMDDTTLPTETGPLNVPFFSIIFDDISDTLFFCIKKRQYLHRNKPGCYRIGNGRLSLSHLPYVQSVVGISTENHNLFGVDPKGTGYILLKADFYDFCYVDDSAWTSIENTLAVRRSMFANSLKSLPTSVIGEWKLSTAQNEKWAVTRRGIWKRVETDWQRIVHF